MTSNVPVDDPEVIRGILANTEALFLDFDGPICSVFAGVGAHNVADQLRTVLADGGHTNLPADVARSEDPFEIFRYAATLGEEEAHYVEAAFTAHEVEAIPTAATTPGAHELLAAWHSTGRPLAVVSNNSDAAVRAYLDLYDLRRFVANISARRSPDPDQLKPSPHLLMQAAQILSVSPSHCSLIGDSSTDIIAAIRAASATIAYANKPGKLASLKTINPDVVVGELAFLNHALQRVRKIKESQN